MNIEQFKSMIVHFPALVYPCFKLQSSFQEIALGKEYWERKKEAMKEGRKVGSLLIEVVLYTRWVVSECNI
jgi:hypothetical protein